MEGFELIKASDGEKKDGKKIKLTFSNKRTGHTERWAGFLEQDTAGGLGDGGGKEFERRKKWGGGEKKKKRHLQ